MPTFDEMSAMVLVEADLTAGQVDDADVKRRLNEELAATWELLLESFEGWASIDVVVTVDSTGQGDLPADFFKPIDLTDASSGTPRSLPAFEFLDRNRVTVKGWCVNASKLMVRPTAYAAGDYTLAYQPQWTDLVASDDTVDFPNNWHMLAVLTAAARFRGDQELSATELEARAKVVLERIQNGSRRRKGPRKVRDVRRGDFPRRRSDPRDWTSD